MMDGIQPEEDAAIRQLVILSRQPPPEGAALAAIGPRQDVLKNLAHCNTSPERQGADDVLFGPGIRIELTPGQDPVTQMLVTLSEDEIGWHVLQRFVTEFHWKLLDPRSGQEWTQAALAQIIYKCHREEA